MIDTVPIAEMSKEMAFSDEEYAGRLSRVREAMSTRGLDLLLVHSLPNICWLSGFQTPLSDWYHCLIVPLNGEMTLQCCDIELAMMNSRIGRIVGVLWERMDEAAADLARIIGDYGFQRRTIGVELRRPGLNGWTLDTLRSALPDSQINDASDLIARLRAVKSLAEIACMRQAARITSTGIKAATAAVRPGVTDNMLCAAASEAMLAAGSEFFSISPIVRTGWRSGVVHATCKRTPIEKGEPIFMEFGGVYQRYCAPLLRTAIIGKPSDTIRRFADAALLTLDILYDNVRPGRSVADVAREAAKGYAHLLSEIQTRGYHAYSVGISFPPVWVEHSIGIRDDAEDVLAPGMTFHTPRSLRVSGKFAVGFSETILVTETGCEILTHHPRELAIC